MYNGIGLTTPRGSGTNGHVQRNWAFVRPGKKDTSKFRSEEDISKLDATLNRPPNKEILTHDRKRKIEVKCLEFEEILEKQGVSSDEIKAKVDSYRKKLIGQGKSDMPKDEFGRIVVRETHQKAEAQQEKNAKLREAFNISEYFVEGSSFDSDRKAKEDLTKSLALQKELDTQRDHKAATAAKEKESSKRYALVRTPSIERNVSPGGSAADNGDHSKKKKKKKTRESSASPGRKRDKKKKSKKRKKESKSKKSKKLRKRKSSESDSYVDNDKDSLYEDSDSESEADAKKSRKKSKKDKKKRNRRTKKKERSSLSEKSRSRSPYLDKHIEENACKGLIGKHLSDNPCRSLSEEKSHNPKESERGHNESSRESRNKLSRSRNDRNESQQHTFNRFDQESFLRSRSYIELNDRSRNIIRDSDLNRKSRSRDYRSRESNETVYNNRNDNRRSRSRQQFRHDSTTEHLKDLKRKNSHPQKKRDSPSVEKRKKYSCSPSPSLTLQNRNSKPYAETTRRKCSPSRTRSRTPRRKSLDSHRRDKTSRSRSSSVNENLQKRSLTPPPKEVESKKNNANTFINQEKSCINSASLSFKDKPPIGRKSRSRSASTSSSNSVSTNTKSSKSRTPLRKVEDFDKPSVSKNTSLSLIEPPTSENRRSRSKSRNVLNEKITKDKQRSKSKSRELEEFKEKREAYKHLTSKTPPPSKVEKKVLSPRSSRDSSELSYSPARRNPERYRDILENTRNLKAEKSNIGDKEEGRKEHGKSSKQYDERERDRKEKASKNDRNHAKPVVHLQSQSDDDSDAIERNTEKLLDEFQESKRERELKDLKMLEQLKTGIAAKAKEKIKTIEKMAASTSMSSSSNNSGEPLVAALADASLVDAIVSKVSTATVAAAESAARRSRSRSRRSRSRNRHEEKANSGGSNSGGGGGERDGHRRRSTSRSRTSRSSSSSRSRSRSHSRRSSRSHSSRSSSSSHSSSRSSSSSSIVSSRSGTRSPSIPRRRGSPSFLDRRRITSRHSSSRNRRH